jgi:Bacterial regulatory proteins, luxR family
VKTFTGRGDGDGERASDDTGESPNSEACAGMTNRNVAAAMFMSPKTVEANLARICAKMGIHSRTELGLYVGQSGG